MSDEKLLPCPFCGSSDIGRHGGSKHCEDCGALGPSAATREEEWRLVLAWNRRVATPSPETGTAAVPTACCFAKLANPGSPHDYLCAEPAPEPVKPPATWRNDANCLDCDALCDTDCSCVCHRRTPAAGTAPTPAEETRWPANNSGTLVWCGNKEHPEQRHYRADDCLFPRLAGPAMSHGTPPQDRYTKGKR